MRTKCVKRLKAHSISSKMVGSPYLGCENLPGFLPAAGYIAHSQASPMTISKRYSYHSEAHFYRLLKVFNVS